MNEYVADNIVVFSTPRVWDWFNLDGQTSYSQIEFCNNVGNNDFSQNFSDMLEALKLDIKPQKIFLDTKNFNVEPPNSPGDGTSPLGWTRVLGNDNILGWKRKWTVDGTPSSITTKYYSNPLTQRELVFKKTGSSSPIGTMTINAKAVEEIPIKQDRWFNKSILLKANQGSYFEDANDFEIYFGQDGTLRYINESFIVAYMPYQNVIYSKTGSSSGNNTLPVIPSGTEYKPYILALLQKKLVVNDSDPSVSS